MDTRFQDLWRTPGVQLVASLWLYFLLLPVCGYVLASWKGFFLGTALLVGVPVGFVALWAAYELRCAGYRLFRQRLSAICPYCVQPLEGRRCCTHCAAELPPVTYLLGGVFSRLCPTCETRIRSADRPVRCFRPNCKHTAKVDDFADVPGKVLLLLVREPTSPPRIGTPLAGSRNASTFTGPGAAFLVIEVEAGEFKPDVLGSDVLRAVKLVWVEEEVVNHVPDALVVLRESVNLPITAFHFAGVVPAEFEGARAYVNQAELIWDTQQLCGN